MEWTCATCEQQATAADWGLLATIGWRLSTDGRVLCSICVKAAAARRAAVTTAGLFARSRGLLTP